MSSSQSPSDADSGLQIYESEEDEDPPLAAPRRGTQYEYQCPVCGVAASALLSNLSQEEMHLDNQFLLSSHEEQCLRRQDMVDQAIAMGFGREAACSAFEASQWQGLESALGTLLSTSRVAITQLQDELISWIAYRGMGISLPAPKHTHRAVLNFLGCCKRFRSLRIPVQLKKPLRHVRDYPPSRFRIVGVQLSGDAIDTPTLTALEGYSTDLRSVELHLCRQLTSVSGLLGCTFLQKLSLIDCVKVHDLSGLAKCTHLMELSLVGCFRASIESLACLASCKKLKALVIGNNPYLSSMLGLGSYIRTIQVFKMYNCPSVDLLGLEDELSHCVDLKASINGDTDDNVSIDPDIQ